MTSINPSDSLAKSAYSLQASAANTSSEVKASNDVGTKATVSDTVTLSQEALNLSAAEIGSANLADNPVVLKDNTGIEPPKMAPLNTGIEPPKMAPLNTGIEPPSVAPLNTGIEPPKPTESN